MSTHSTINYRTLTDIHQIFIKSNLIYFQLEEAFADQLKVEQLQRAEEEKRKERERMEEKKKREHERILEVRIIYWNLHLHSKNNYQENDGNIILYLYLRLFNFYEK